MLPDRAPSEKRSSQVRLIVSADGGVLTLLAAGCRHELRGPDLAALHPLQLHRFQSYPESPTIVGLVELEVVYHVAASRIHIDLALESESGEHLQLPPAIEQLVTRALGGRP